MILFIGLSNMGNYYIKKFLLQVGIHMNLLL